MIHREQLNTATPARCPVRHPCTERSQEKVVEKHLDTSKNGEEKQHYSLETICDFGDSLVPVCLRFHLPSASLSFFFSFSVEGTESVCFYQLLDP